MEEHFIWHSQHIREKHYKECIRMDLNFLWYGMVCYAARHKYDYYWENVIENDRNDFNILWHTANIFKFVEFLVHLINVISIDNIGKLFQESRLFYFIPFFHCNDVIWYCDIIVIVSMWQRIILISF